MKLQKFFVLLLLLLFIGASAESCSVFHKSKYKHVSDCGCPSAGKTQRAGGGR